MHELEEAINRISGARASGGKVTSQ
jgi:hypothetical protein